MSLKQRVYTISLFLLFLPFVFMTDFFPFLRFAMFAEPVKKVEIAEVFFITITDGGQEIKFNPENYELQDESFQYIMRNYFYRGQSKELLQKINKIEGVGRAYKLYQVTFSVDDPKWKDTTLIESLVNEE